MIFGVWYLVTEMITFYQYDEQILSNVYHQMYWSYFTAEVSNIHKGWENRRNGVFCRAQLQFATQS